MVKVLPSVKLTWYMQQAKHSSGQFKYQLRMSWGKESISHTMSIKKCIYDSD